MADSDKQMVIFYDCCMPQPLIRDIVIPRLPNADHFLVRNHFPPKIYKRDALLFSEVEKMHREQYRDRLCIFVSCDGDFSKKGKGPYPKDTAVEVIYMSHLSSISNPKERERRMEELVKMIGIKLAAFLMRKESKSQ